LEYQSDSFRWCLTHLDGVSILTTELRHWIDLLHSLPKDCDHLVLFGIICSFIGQFDGEALDCPWTLASIFCEWATDLKSVILQSSLECTSLYWKQAKLYAYALLCHSIGERTHKDFLKMAEYIILFRNKRLFASKSSHAGSLDPIILAIMSMRIDGTICAIRNNIHHLTKCLSLVVDGIPSVLIWSSVVYAKANKRGCFKAISESGNLFSLNLLNGCWYTSRATASISSKQSTLPKNVWHLEFGIMVVGFRHF